MRLLVVREEERYHDRVPETSLEIVEGSDLLSLYEWNTRRAQHYFCKRCGIYVYHRKRGAGLFWRQRLLPGRIRPGVGFVRPTEGANMPLVDPQARPEWPGPRATAGAQTKTPSPL